MDNILNLLKDLQAWWAVSAPQAQLLAGQAVALVQGIGAFLVGVIALGLSLSAVIGKYLNKKAGAAIKQACLKPLNLCDPKYK